MFRYILNWESLLEIINPIWRLIDPDCFNRLISIYILTLIDSNWFDSLHKGLKIKNNKGLKGFKPLMLINWPNIYDWIYWLIW